MKIHSSIGSKERLFEMMGKVNKIQINEVFNPNSVLDFSFEELMKGTLNVVHSNTQATGDESFVELVCTDKEGNSITFSFKADTIQGDQSGVAEISNVSLINFTFDDTTGAETVEMGEETLTQFNAQHASEFLSLISDYVDVEVGEPTEIDELYEEAIKKIDSYPFGGMPERMQTSKAYGDEKPTNPKVRVKSPELDKFEFVDEAIHVKPDVHNTGQKYFNKLDPMTKEVSIMFAKQFIDQQLAAQGLQSFDIPQDKYREEIKRVAIARYEQHLTSMNEEEGKEKSDYPDQMGKKFKPKNQMPKKKKKPQTVVKLGEQFEDDDEYSEIPDLEIPVDKRAKRAAKSDIAQDDADVNFDDTYDFKFNEQYEEDEFDIPELDIPMDKNAEKAARGDIHRDIQSQNIGMDSEEWKHSIKPDMKFTDIVEDEKPETDDVEQIEVDKEEIGDEIKGGKADDKSPQEFDKEQIKMGLKIEMEHTDNPMIAIEIAMDHLSEFPDYYTRLDKMEKEAKSEKSEDGEESEDEELTDRLLGYEPKNVGDEMELEEEDLFGRMGDVFRPDSGSDSTGGNRTKAFKIGEWAVGGIIKVDITGQKVNISALDWNTKQPVQTDVFPISSIGEMDAFLNELTSSYYAEMVLNWINGKS